jgi:PAS domain S-box-containing protein
MRYFHRLANPSAPRSTESAKCPTGQGIHRLPRACGPVLVAFVLVLSCLLFQRVANAQAKPVGRVLAFSGLGLSSPSMTIADHQMPAALERWGLNESNLPPGSVMLNPQPTLWMANRRLVVAAILVFLVQTLLIILLLVQRAKGKKDGEELFRSNDRLRLAMEAGKSVGWELDLASGRDVWFGDLNTMFGIPSETFVGTVGDFFRYVHPGDRKRVSEAMADARQNRSVYHAEFRTIKPDGTSRFVGSRGRFEYGRKGEPKRMLGMAIDITELRQAEEARRASEDRFRQFFTTLPEFAFMTSPHGELLDANPAACKALGYVRDELIGKPISILYAPESHARMASLFETWKREGRLHNEELVMVSKRGQKRTVLINVGSVKDPDGKLMHSTSVQVDITERKRIQEELRESQSRLGGIVASAMDVIIVVDSEQRIVVFNSAAEKMFGCAARDAIGGSIERFIPLRFRSVYLEYPLSAGGPGVADRATEGQDIKWALRTNGEEFPVEASISQMKTEGERLFTVIVRDVTERLRAEEAWRRLAAIVESSDDAIISMNLDGIATSWNPGAERMYGYTESEVLGRSLDVIVPSELRTEEDDILRRLKAGQATEHNETIRITKAGQRRDVSLTISPVRNPGGDVVGGSMIGRDITDRKRIDALLRESEGRFRLVANAAPVLIWMSGPDTLCTYFNDSWLLFTGRSLEQELGNGWAEGVHADDRDACWATYEKAFNARQPFRMEYRLRRYDGEFRWILDNGVPRFHADGSFAGYIGSCMEITDRKFAEEALSDMGRRLIEAHEEERTWIARELHDDINQRIALLAVRLESLKRSIPKQQPVAIEQIEDLSQLASDLGSDVQALSRRLHSSKLEYLGIATAASSFCAELAERSDVAIDFRSEGIPKRLPQEIALCLFRVLQEALQNAVKHSGSRNVQVSLTSSSNQIELSVRDAGIGFDLEEAVKGQGLGLISMRERLKLVQGELSIDTHSQRGTFVRVNVPLSPATRAAQA